MVRCSISLIYSYYSFRLLFLTFLGPVNSFKASLKDMHEAPQLMAWPLIILAFGSIFVGYMAKDMMIGLGTPFWNNNIFILPINTIVLKMIYSTVYKIYSYCI